MTTREGEKTIFKIDKALGGTKEHAADRQSCEKEVKEVMMK